MVGRSVCPCSRSSKAMATIASIRSLLIAAAERWRCQQTDPGSRRPRQEIRCRQIGGSAGRWRRLVCSATRGSVGGNQRIPEVFRRSGPRRNHSAFAQEPPNLCAARGV